MLNKHLKKIRFNFDTAVIYLRFIVGAIFVYASLDKISEPSAFSNAIASYEFSSLLNLSIFNNILALSLPWLEMILGLCLIFGVFFKEALNFIIVLLIFFIILLVQADIRGLNLEDCGCGLNKSSIIETIIRDLFLICACLVIKFRRFVSIRNRYDI